MAPKCFFPQEVTNHFLRNSKVPGGSDQKPQAPPIATRLGFELRGPRLRGLFRPGAERAGGVPRTGPMELPGRDPL